MRLDRLARLAVGVCFGAGLAAARADDLSDGKTALRKGDVRTAEIELRNAVRDDPRNAEAHFWLARASFELGNTVAAEREALAARNGGYDGRQALPLLADVLLVQRKFETVLNTLRPDGKDAADDAAVLVARGDAFLGVKKPAEARQAFAEAARLAPDAAAPLLAEARLALARGDLPGAQGKIDRAVQAEPKSADALLAKAQLLRLQNNAAGAIAILTGLIADRPDVPRARLDRASAELVTGQTMKARADVADVLNVSPGNVQAIYLGAVTDAQAGNDKAADAGLQRISAFLGQIPRAYYLQAVVKQRVGQWEQAEDAARKYVGRTPDEPAGAKLLARILFARQRPDQAVDVLMPFDNAGRADAEIYDLLGRAAAALGDGEHAAAAFGKAGALAPSDVGVQTRLASVRMAAGDPEAAVGDLEHALTLAPTLPAVSEQLFFAALGTGNTQNAALALQRIRAAGGDTAVVGNLGGLLKLAQLDYAGAEAVFAGLAQTHPDFIPARINLARVESMLGDGAGAENTLRSILARQPTENPALRLLVAEYGRSNRLPEAVALLERAHRADPAMTGITAALGGAYLRAGSPQKALDLLSALKGPDATTTAVLALRATAHRALGRTDEARADYQQMIEQDPTAIGARRQLVALLAEAGAVASARKVLSAGIAASPADYPLRQDDVMIELRSAGLDAALAVAERIRSENPDHPEMAVLKGDAYLAAKRPMDAVAAWMAAYAAAPSDMLVSRLCGVWLGSAQPDRARQLANDWSGKRPNDPVAMEQAAEVDIATVHYDDAATALERLLQRKPHDAVALNNLAWVYQQQGKNEDARGMARQAFTVAPNAQTADTLGWILTASGDAAQGVALLRQAHSEAAVDPRIHYHFAVALNDTGDRQTARQELQRVVAGKTAFAERPAAQKLLDALARGS